MRIEPIIQVHLAIKDACTGYARKFWSCTGYARLIEKRLGKSQVICRCFRAHVLRLDHIFRYLSMFNKTTTNVRSHPLEGSGDGIL